MIGLLLMGGFLGFIQAFVKPWLYKNHQSRHWVQTYLGRGIILIWLLWLILLFLWLSKPVLAEQRWAYPLLALLMSGLLWVLLKEYWLGWLFAWRWGRTENLQVYWQGQTLKINKIRSFSIVLADNEKQYEVPYSQAQSLVSPKGNQASKKRKVYRGSFILAEQFAKQHNIAQQLQRELLQSPWTLPSAPPKVTLKAVDGSVEVSLEVPTNNLEKMGEVVGKMETLYQPN